MTCLLLMASNNPGKLAELRHLLSDLPVHIVTPADLGLALTVEEDGLTYAENATRKALAFARAAGVLALADDSGLEVDALRGEPVQRLAEVGLQGLELGLSLGEVA